MQMFSSKVHPVCHVIANGIKPESSSKTTDKQLLKSCMLGHKVIYVIYTNCSYNNMVKGIRLHDKNIFVYTGKNHTSKCF